MFDSIIILGPTATGKSALADQLATKLFGAIINADSQQIYKDLSIGTAKPTQEELNAIPHYLFDFVDTKSTYSVAEYKNDATKIINELHSKNVLPIIVGGTGLYIQSLMYDMSYGNSIKNDDIRDKYINLAKQYGNNYVYDILYKVDPESAQKLHPNDLKRVIRALEIYYSTGKLMSKVNTKKRTSLNPLVIFLNMDRKLLYSKIENRVDKMISMGLEKEVKSLIDNGVNQNCQCMSAIGYKEWFDYFSNKTTIEQVIDLIKKNTRHYAKRQITWFGHLENVNEIDVSSNNKTELVNYIIELFNQKK